jgi:hypothetical protein
MKQVTDTKFLEGILRENIKRDSKCEEVINICHSSIQFSVTDLRNERLPAALANSSSQKIVMNATSALFPDKRSLSLW